MATFVSCDFTDTDATNLESHTPEGTGDTWTEHGSYAAGNTKIQTNRAYPTVTPTVYYASGTPATAEYDVTGVIYRVTGAASNMGVCGRIATAANTMYWARYDVGAGGWQLFKFVAGTATQLGSTVTQTLTNGVSYTLKLEIRDAAKKVYVDGVEIISSADNVITAAGQAGFRSSVLISSTTGLHLDSLIAEDPGGGGVSGSSTLTVTATLGAGPAAVSKTASLSVVATLGSGPATVTQTGPLSVTAALSPTHAVGAASALTVTATLTPIVSGSQTATAPLSVVVDLGRDDSTIPETGVGNDGIFAAVSVAAPLTVTATLGAGPAIATNTSALTVTATLAPSASSVGSTGSTLTVTATLGAATAAVNATSALTVTAALASSGVGIRTATSSPSVLATISPSGHVTTFGASALTITAALIPLTPSDFAAPDFNGPTQVTLVSSGESTGILVQSGVLAALDVNAGTTEASLIGDGLSEAVLVTSGALVVADVNGGATTAEDVNASESDAELVGSGVSTAPLF